MDGGQGGQDGDSGGIMQIEELLEAWAKQVIRAQKAEEETTRLKIQIKELEKLLGEKNGPQKTD